MWHLTHKTQGKNAVIVAALRNTGNRGAQTYDFENFSGNDGRAIATVAHYPGPSTWNPVQPTAVAVLEVPGTGVAVRP